MYRHASGTHKIWKTLGKSAGVGLAIIQYGCIAHCTLEFVGDFVVCSGPSMEPTVKDGDIVLTEHISAISRKIHRGDIIIAKSPSNPRQHVCKRVTRKEGDRIDSPPPTSPYRYIPRGHVWLEGDNSANSSDSRIYGPVPSGLIRSRVFFRVWPLYSFGKVKDKRITAKDDNL